MACKCKKFDPHEMCEECPEWIFTLADLIMCMMGLFVLLWVLKTEGAKAPTPAEAIKAERETLQRVVAGFNGNWTNDVESRERMQNLNGPGEKGETTESPESPEGTDPQASIIRPGREVTTGGRLLFPKGDATLTADLKHRLDQVAEKIRGIRLIVNIKGHAGRDDFGPGAQPSQTMALSLKRAQVVADYLTSKGIDPEVLRLQGCGTFEPVRTGDPSVNGQVLNRRVEVFTSDTRVEELQDPKATGAPVVSERITVSSEKTPTKEKAH